MTEPNFSFNLIAPVNTPNVMRAHEIRKMTKSLGIESTVRITLKDLTEREKAKGYANARCFIFPPKREYQESIEPPLSVLEAMASGLPVIATNTYSVREAVMSGTNGFIVSIEDYGSLKDRVAYLLRADEGRWQKWSVCARKAAIDKFSIGNAAKKLARMHANILEDTSLT